MGYQKEIDRGIARERIGILLKLAAEIFHEDRLLSKRYVQLARNIGTKCGVRIPRQQKQFICKNCRILLVPGVNCRVRTRSNGQPRVVISCLECGVNKRLSMEREREKRRRIGGCGGDLAK